MSICRFFSVLCLNLCNIRKGMFVVYEHGDEIKIVVSFYKNGKKKSHERYYKDKLCGVQLYFYANGNIESVQDYLFGEPHGKVIKFHENGNKKLEQDYWFGSPNGKVVSYHENGNREYIGEVLDGENNNYCKKYGINGDLINTTRYKKGIKEGNFAFCCENGDSIYGIYKDDVKRSEEIHIGNKIIEKNFYCKKGFKYNSVIFKDDVIKIFIGLFSGSNKIEYKIMVKKYPEKNFYQTYYKNYYKNKTNSLTSFYKDKKIFFY